MKNIIFLVANFVLLSSLNGQEVILNSGGGDYSAIKIKTECVNDEQRQAIFNVIQENRVDLEQRNILQKSVQQLIPHPLFVWPVVKNPSAPYSNVWSISNYVDHNPNYPNLVQDWACGDRTYDTSSGYNHKGIDIYTWPFSWYQMDNDQAWVVAAADGVIVGKNDGNFDRNCAFNSLNWNAVYIQHSDGSVAWYGHLKNGSLTSKSIGEFVQAGEKIGVVGSSGNSTGPHLHFEVYDLNNQLVDTYQGTCNTWSSSVDSWWINQKPYQDPKINAVLTHSQQINFNNCPQTESTYLNDNFAAGSSVIIAIYLADQLPGTSGLIEIIRPDNSVATSFTKTFTDFYYGSWWYWTYSSVTFNQPGVWKLRFTYLGNVVEHNFEYGTLANQSFIDIPFQIYPNPTKDFIVIENKNNIKIKEIKLLDLSGKTVVNYDSMERKLDLSGLSAGVYVLAINSEEGIFKNKIVKE